jgi:hypothetical protein
MNTNKLLDTSALVEVKQYIDEIKEAVETGSGIQVIEGTADAPIVASELELGVYVISGVVQSSTTNTTSTEIVKRVYSIRRDDLTTILWEENPMAKITNYIVFYHEGEAPLISNTTYTSIEDVRDLIANAVIDGGTI